MLEQRRSIYLLKHESCEKKKRKKLKKQNKTKKEAKKKRVVYSAQLCGGLGLLLLLVPVSDASL